MEFDPNQVSAGVQAAKYVGESSYAIWDKIRVARENRNKDEAINNLEEIITDLIADKNKLIQTCQFYEEQLITQTTSDEDIDYITEKFIPLLENVINKSDDPEGNREKLEMAKPLISKETFKIMQLLGFNFKQATGEPLTQLLRNFILSQVPEPDKSTEYNMLLAQRNTEYFRMVQDPEAYERHRKLSGIEE